MPSWEVAGHNFCDVTVVIWNVGYLTSFVFSYSSEDNSDTTEKINRTCV